MSYVPDVTGHRWRWIFKRWPRASKNLHRLIEAVFGDPEIPWHPSPGEHGGVDFSRLVLDGEWPYDREIVTASIDALGRLKRCTREKVVHIETGRSYADLHRMLRLPDDVLANSGYPDNTDTDSGDS